MENEKDDDNETTVSGVSLAWDTIIGQSTAKVPHGVAQLAQQAQNGRSFLHFNPSLCQCTLPVYFANAVH